MGELALVYGCECHNGNMFIIDSTGRVVRVVYTRDNGSYIGTNLSRWAKYRVINSIHDVIIGLLT